MPGQVFSPKPVTTGDSRPVFDNGRVLANGAKAEKQFKFAGCCQYLISEKLFLERALMVNI